MVPDKIYVIEYPDWVSRFWVNKKMDDVEDGTLFHEYIRKDALLEWAKGELEKASKRWNTMGRRDAFMDVIEKIESL